MLLYAAAYISPIPKAGTAAAYSANMQCDKSEGPHEKSIVLSLCYNYEYSNIRLVMLASLHNIP